MSKLIFKTALVVAIIIICYATITYLNIYSAYHDRHDYRQFLDNRSNLLRTTKSPKILFIGGSNLSYGLDSEKIHQIYKMPVINTAIHAGIGLNYMMQSVKPFIGKNDIVVLSPEYEHFFIDSFYGNDPLMDILFLDPKGWQYVLTNFKQLKAMAYRNSIRPIVINVFSKHPQYLKDSYNMYGDFIYHLNAKPVRPLAETKIWTKDINVDAINAISEFISYVHASGAKITYTYPPIVNVKYNKEKLQIQDVDSAIKRLFPEVTVSPENYVFDENYFFDTYYHLNAAGRKVRTEKLIQEINGLLIN